MRPRAAWSGPVPPAGFGRPPHIHVRVSAAGYEDVVTTYMLARGERSGRVYRLGDPLKVRVARVDLDERKIDFMPEDAAQEAAKAAEAPRAKRRRKPRRKSLIEMVRDKDADACFTTQPNAEFARRMGLKVIDLDPQSKTYSQIVGRTEVPNVGDEMHHFGWNACSAALCPFAPHPHIERRYLIDTLRQHNGNITQSARYALQDRRAFGRLVKRYGIDRNST